MQAQHRMRRTEIWATGAEEWWCPDCGRRLLLRWPPNYAKLVLDPGDERASHTGAMAVADNSGGPRPALRWRRWLADNGIDWDGTAA
jgi:hypothetical protein